MSRNPPDVAEGVLQFAGAIAVKLIFDRAQQLASGRYHVVSRLIHIFEIEMEGNV